MQHVKDIMTRGLEHVSASATIQHAAEQMAEKDIGFLAISNGQAAGGVLTDRDIIVRCLAQHKDPENTTVQECMSTGIASLTEDADVQEAARIMQEKQIRRVLVTDESGKLTGVVSLGDLGTGCDDEPLRAQVLEKVSAECAPC